MREITCPHSDCKDSERTFDTERAMKVHHSHAHGESIAKKETCCDECGAVFEYYPSIKDGILCSKCLSNGVNPVRNKPDSIPNSVEKKEVECTRCDNTRDIPKSDYEKNKNYFCGDECYNKYRAERNSVDTKCDQCKDDLTLSRTRYEDHNNNFCGKECRLKFQRNSIKIFCHYCGDSKKKPRSHVIGNNRNFCSNDCRKKYQKEDKQVNVECAECGETFTKIKSRYTPYELHFCSDNCQYEHYTKNDKLDYNRYGRVWISTREDVRDRDDHKCQICGKDSEDIGRRPSAHHITPLSWFYNNEDYSIEDAHYMKNLILLCPTHHNLVENDKLSLIEELPREKVDKLEFKPPDN